MLVNYDRNKKPGGILDTNTSNIRKLKKKGFTVIGLGHEVVLLQEAILDILTRLKKD